MHHRRSIRLKEYDYSMPGAYFLTMVTYQRKLLFGNINGEKVLLNKVGKIVERHWKNTENIRPNISLDEFIIMPNHVHGIIFISEIAKEAPNTRRGVLPYAPVNKIRSPSQTIGSIIRGLKGTTAKQINIMRGTRGQPVWQRNYYERVIRNERELIKIREYIHFNPMKWESDDENPDNAGNN